MIYAEVDDRLAICAQPSRLTWPDPSLSQWPLRKKQHKMKQEFGQQQLK